MNREISDTNQLGASDTFSYNTAGDVTQEVDKDGRVRTFQYDTLGQQTAENWLANGNGASVNISVAQQGSGSQTDTVQWVQLPSGIGGGEFPVISTATM